MYSNQKLSEALALLGTIDPATLANTEVFSDVIDFGACEQALAILSLGNLAAETVDFKFYSCDSNGTNAAAVTGKAATQLAAHASNNDNTQLIMNVRNTDLLPSGKQYGKFGAVTGGATGGPASLVVLGQLRQGSATDGDLASVQQIVA